MREVEDLERLARMLDEGKVTRTEYERLKTELLAEPSAGTDDPMAGKPPGVRRSGREDDPPGVLGRSIMEVSNSRPAGGTGKRTVRRGASGTCDHGPG